MLAMRTLVGDSLSAFLQSPLKAGRGPMLPWARSCRKLPVPLPSLASDMNSASCWTLPDLAPGTCLVEQVKLFASLLCLMGSRSLQPSLGPRSVRAPKTPRPGPLSSAFLCILKYQPDSPRLDRLSQALG